MKFNKKWSDIGFKKQNILKNIFKGFLLCTVFYAIGFLIEFISLKLQNNPAHMEFFVTGFSLTGNVVKHTGILFVLMCIFFNIINVWMEEGLFRGFYIEYLNKKYSIKKAIFIAAFFFGIWHLVTPFRSLLDGDMNIMTFIVMSIGYVILSGVMGIKWGILQEEPKVSRKGIAYTSIFAIIILIYVLVSYIIGYRLNTIQPYEYNLNLKNVIGTLGFQLFLSGTSEEILFRAFIKSKSIIYPVIMHGLSNFFMVGIGYIFAIVLNNI